MATMAIRVTEQKWVLTRLVSLWRLPNEVDFSKKYARHSSQSVYTRFTFPSPRVSHDISHLRQLLELLVAPTKEVVGFVVEL